jgi:HAD superfamily hydrolase (TIGR01450 family)
VLAERFDAFLFDLDGVIYIGDELLPGSKETLARLREAGKAIRFLTNDPRPTRAQLSRRLDRMGIEADAEEIVTSGWATASYLRHNRVRSAYVIGSRGLAAEIGGVGVEVVDKGSCEAVVVGSDEHVSYSHIRQASRLIFEGAWFIATNADGSVPSPKGPLPGTGAIVEAVRVTTGERPTVIGKPYPSMFDAAVRGLDHEVDRVAMVGDTPETDIVGAHQAGITGILVSKEKLPYPPHDPRSADATIPDLTGLFDSRVTVRRWEEPRTEGYGVPTFHIVDVFTEEKYAGNQLAVVRGAGRLSDGALQKIASEMNYSETTFVLSEEERDGGDPERTARVRGVSEGDRRGRAAQLRRGAGRRPVADRAPPGRHRSPPWDERRWP